MKKKEFLTEKDIIKTLNLKEEDVRILKRAIEFKLINIPYPADKIEEIPVILSYVEGLRYTKELYEEYLKNLGVKKSWLKELEETGIIKPEMNVVIKIRSKEINAKVWNIKTIQEEEILKFIEKKRENKDLARQKLKQLHQEIKVKKEEIKEMLKTLELYNPVLVVMFYLYHLNHYAKTEKYEKYKDEIYELKKEALIKAYKENPDLFSLHFIPRGDKIIYCDECREIAYEDWKYAGTGYSFGEWLKKEEPCPNCEVIKDYYSLVEFEIKTEIVNFSFHLPYPEVENIFNKKNLKEKYIENAESIKFGRGLEGYEALIVTLKTALKKVKEYVNKFDMECNVWRSRNTHSFHL